jgi:hypothetical protein
MENSQIASLSLPNYVDFVEAMALLNGKTAEEVNYDYCFWHGVISEKRYEEAKEFMKELAELNSSDYNYYTA